MHHCATDRSPTSWRLKRQDLAEMTLDREAVVGPKRPMRDQGEPHGASISSLGSDQEEKARWQTPDIQDAKMVIGDERGRAAGVL